MTKVATWLIALFAVLFAVYLIIAKLVPTLNWGLGSEHGNKNFRDYQKDIDKSNVTLSESQLKSMADILFTAMNRSGTSEDSIYKQLGKLNTKDDWLALVAKFGTRLNDSGWSQDMTGTLPMWLEDELDRYELAKVQDILSEIEVYEF